MVPRRQDDLEGFIAERTAANSDFATIVEGAFHRRQLLRQLGSDRQAGGLTRTVVAARMATSESAVARIEAREADTKLSTLARYAAALGKRIEWRVVDQQESPSAV